MVSVSGFSGSGDGASSSATKAEVVHFNSVGSRHFDGATGHLRNL